MNIRYMNKDIENNFNKAKQQLFIVISSEKVHWQGTYVLEP